VDLQLSEQQELLQQTVRKFAQQECREVVALCDRAGSLRDPSLQKRMMELVEKMVQMSLIGMCLPEAYGGGGQELLSAILCIEQLAAVSPLAAADPSPAARCRCRRSSSRRWCAGGGSISGSNDADYLIPSP
jgi:alkylation response protein AidB-like acyl-CoA dehydrogenase